MHLGHWSATAPRARRTARARTTGRGLLGMQQRVALLGGHLVAGPAPDRGFVVTARLPVAEWITVTVRVLVADDQPLMRTALVTCLSAETDFEVVGEASDGIEAIELVATRAARRGRDGRPHAEHERRRQRPVTW